MSDVFDKDAADRERGKNEPDDIDLTHVGAEARDLLRSTVHRVEDLEVQKAEIGDSIKELFSEAKSQGLDTKIIRQVIRRRAMEKAEREKQDVLLALYEGVFA